MQMTLPYTATLIREKGEEVINAELLKLWEWLGANKLSLNIAKTKYMVLHISKKNVIYPNLKVNNSNIERITQFNFMGVILHSHMMWNKHIYWHLVSSQKCLSRICLNYYIQYFSTSSFPLLSLTVGVCCQRKLFSASAPKENSKIITNSDYLAHTEPLCKRLRILKILDMFFVAI